MAPRHRPRRVLLWATLLEGLGRGRAGGWSRVCWYVRIARATQECWPQEDSPKNLLGPQDWPERPWKFRTRACPQCLDPPSAVLGGRVMVGWAIIPLMQCIGHRDCTLPGRPLAEVINATGVSRARLLIPGHSGGERLGRQWKVLLAARVALADRSDAMRTSGPIETLG